MKPREFTNRASKVPAESSLSAEQLEMSEFLRRSLDDVEAGRTVSAIAAIEELATKQKLRARDKL